MFNLATRPTSVSHKKKLGFTSPEGVALFEAPQRLLVFADLLVQIAGLWGNRFNL